MKSIYTLAVIALLGILGISDARAVYDPYVGRWLSRDPVGEQVEQPMLTLRLPGAMQWQRSSPNLYSYVANDPINYIDPLGLWGFFFFGSGTVATPNPAGIMPAAEGITLFGWDSSKGFYSEQILAAGAEVGTHNDNISGFKGVATDSCGKKTGINLLEGNFGPEAGLGGAHVGSGAFTTGDGDAGNYAHAGVDALGEGFSVGGGISLW